jgi:hypothetical protein
MAHTVGLFSKIPLGECRLDICVHTSGDLTMNHMQGTGNKIEKDKEKGCASAEVDNTEAARYLGEGEGTGQVHVYQCTVLPLWFLYIA